VKHPPNGSCNNPSKL